MYVKMAFPLLEKKKTQISGCRFKRKSPWNANIEDVYVRDNAPSFTKTYTDDCAYDTDSLNSWSDKSGTLQVNSPSSSSLTLTYCANPSSIDTKTFDICSKKVFTTSPSYYVTDSQRESNKHRVDTSKREDRGKIVSTRRHHAATNRKYNGKPTSSLRSRIDFRDGVDFEDCTYTINSGCSREDSDGTFTSSSGSCSPVVPRTSSTHVTPRHVSPTSSTSTSSTHTDSIETGVSDTQTLFRMSDFKIRNVITKSKEYLKLSKKCALFAKTTPGCTSNGCISDFNGLDSGDNDCLDQTYPQENLTYEQDKCIDSFYEIVHHPTAYATAYLTEQPDVLETGSDQQLDLFDEIIHHPTNISNNTKVAMDMSILNFDTAKRNKTPEATNPNSDNKAISITQKQNGTLLVSNKHGIQKVSAPLHATINSNKTYHSFWETTKALDGISEPSLPPLQSIAPGTCADWEAAEGQRRPTVDIPALRGIIKNSANRTRLRRTLIPLSDNTYVTPEMHAKNVKMDKLAKIRNMLKRKNDELVHQKKVIGQKLEQRSRETYDCDDLLHLPHVTWDPKLGDVLDEQGNVRYTRKRVKDLWKMKRNNVLIPAENVKVDSFVTHNDKYDVKIKDTNPKKEKRHTTKRTSKGKFIYSSDSDEEDNIIRARKRLDRRDQTKNINLQSDISDCESEVEISHSLNRKEKHIPKDEDVTKTAKHHKVRYKQADMSCGEHSRSSSERQHCKSTKSRISTRRSSSSEDHVSYLRHKGKNRNWAKPYKGERRKRDVFAAIVNNPIVEYPKSKMCEEIKEKRHKKYRIESSESTSTDGSDDESIICKSKSCEQSNSETDSSCFSESLNESDSSEAEINNTKRESLHTMKPIQSKHPNDKTKMSKDPKYPSEHVQNHTPCDDDTCIDTTCKPYSSGDSKCPTKSSHKQKTSKDHESHKKINETSKRESVVSTKEVPKSSNPMTSQELEYKHKVLLSKPSEKCKYETISTNHNRLQETTDSQNNKDYKEGKYPTVMESLSSGGSSKSTKRQQIRTPTLQSTPQPSACTPGKQTMVSSLLQSPPYILNMESKRLTHDSNMSDVTHQLSEDQLTDKEFQFLLQKDKYNRRKFVLEHCRIEGNAARCINGNSSVYNVGLPTYTPHFLKSIYKRDNVETSQTFLPHSRSRSHDGSSPYGRSRSYGGFRSRTVRFCCQMDANDNTCSRFLTETDDVTGLFSVKPKSRSRTRPCLRENPTSRALQPSDREDILSGIISWEKLNSSFVVLNDIFKKHSKTIVLCCLCLLCVALSYSLFVGNIAGNVPKQKQTCNGLHCFFAYDEEDARVENGDSIFLLSMLRKSSSTVFGTLSYITQVVLGDGKDPKSEPEIKQGLMFDLIPYLTSFKNMFYRSTPYATPGKMTQKQAVNPPSDGGRYKYGQGKNSRPKPRNSPIYSTTKKQPEGRLSKANKPPIDKNTGEILNALLDAFPLLGTIAKNFKHGGQTHPDRITGKSKIGKGSAKTHSGKPEAGYTEGGNTPGHKVKRGGTKKEMSQEVQKSKTSVPDNKTPHTSTQGNKRKTKDKTRQQKVN